MNVLPFFRDPIGNWVDLIVYFPKQNRCLSVFPSSNKSLSLIAYSSFEASRLKLCMHSPQPPRPSVDKLKILK